MFEYLLRPVIAQLSTITSLLRTILVYEAAKRDFELEKLALLRSIGNDTKYLRRAAAKWLLPVPGPLVPRLMAEQYRKDNDMLVYTAEFPDNPADLKDITAKRFRVNGGEPKDYPVEATASDEFSVDQDSEVTIALTYVDDAGNESQPATQVFTAKDTIAPDAPGDFKTVTLVREE
jgi:hypothetical protein